MKAMNPLLTLVLLSCTSVILMSNARSLPVDTSETSTVRMISVVFRHGQRTPADTYPNDPYINFDFKPYGWGQLTNDGKNQQYDQGKWLRERYNDVLGSVYSPNYVEAWTTDVDRTKMSMQLMMAGLYPPEGDQIWNSDLHWQPVPSNYQKLSEDKLLLVRSCPRYSEALKETMNTKKAKDIVRKYNDLYEVLSENTGVKVKDPEGVQDIYSTLKAEEDFKLDLPSWTKPVYPDLMAEATAMSFVLNALTPELQKIKGGPLLKKILDDSVAKAHDKTTKKIYAYAGHDSTVANLLMALKVWDTQVPVYNIMAIMELHEVSPQSFGLKVLLRNTTLHEPYVLQIPGCTDICPLPKVQELTSSMVPSDTRSLCKAKSESYVPDTDGGP